MRRRYVFSSDWHLGAGEAWDWLTPDQHGALGAWLDMVIAAPPNGLVLLGDLVDNWVWPTDLRPPYLSELMRCRAAEDVFSRLRDLDASGCAVYIVQGNHDADLTERIIRSALPRAIWCGHRWTHGELRVIAEHGHLATAFNRPDPRGVHWPLGYWISRALTREDGASITAGEVARSSVDDLLEAAFTRQLLPQSVWEAVCERAGLSGGVISMTGGVWSLEAVSERYADILVRLTELHGLSGVSRMLRGDLGDLSWRAEQAHVFGWDVHICGHTHKAELHCSCGKARVNCGAWAADGEQTWVEVLEDGGDLVIELRGLDGVMKRAELNRSGS